MKYPTWYRPFPSFDSANRLLYLDATSSPVQFMSSTSRDMSGSARPTLSLLYVLIILYQNFKQAEGASLGFLRPLRSARTTVLVVSSHLTTEDFHQPDEECARGGNFDYPRCSPGYWCIGSNPPRCKKRSKLGGPCGTEYQVCGELMDCVDSKCVMRTFAARCTWTLAPAARNRLTGSAFPAYGASRRSADD